jgi:hypothetical protein
MASTFKNYTAQSIGATPTTVHTGPGATQTTVIGMTVCNRTAGAIKVSVSLNDGAETYIVGGPTVATMGADVPVGGSLVVIGGDQKLIMEAADTLNVVSDTATSADVVVSVLELT